MAKKVGKAKVEEVVEEVEVTEEETPKAKKKTPAKTAEGMVTIKDLSEEYGIEAASIRQVLRAAGMKAPKTDNPEGTFGPRAKYQWPEGSKELKKVKDTIQAAIDAQDEEE